MISHHDNEFFADNLGGGPSHALALWSLISTARLSRPCGASLETPAGVNRRRQGYGIREAMVRRAETRKDFFGHGFRFTEHTDFTVNSLGVISHRRTQTQRTRILDRIYMISRIRTVIA